MAICGAWAEVLRADASAMHALQLLQRGQAGSSSAAPAPDDAPDAKKQRLGGPLPCAFPPPCRAAGMVSSTQAAGRTDAGKDEGVGMPRPETCVKHSRRTHRGIGHTKSASVSVDQFWRSHLRARHLGLRAKHSLSPLQPDLGARPSASGNETNTTEMQGWARRGRRGLDKV